MNSSISVARRITELLAHVGRRAASGAADANLTSVQWSALRYFSRANRFSRTPSAFASFQATTRGTASATVNALVRDGCLVRQRSSDDGRSVLLVPTESGYRLLDEDPMHAMECAVDLLPREQQQSLANALPVIIGSMADSDGGASFGTCHHCCHLARSGAASACPYFCEREAAPLSEPELDGLCVHFEPANGH